MSLSIEIVTPRGLALKRAGLDKVIMRRREDDFEEGSEVVVLPHHGEMMVRLPDSEIGLVDEQRTVYVHVNGGFAEVRDDEVVVLTAGAEVGESVAISCTE
jgi:F-type H+-transporting ATPase subunit epsilon